MKSAIPLRATLKKSWLAAAFLVAAFLWGSPKAFASIGGNLTPLCGAGDVLFANLTSVSINFELSLGGGVPCDFSASWKDASGHAQSVTLLSNVTTGFNPSASVSSSLPPGGTISWSSSGESRTANIYWQLERAPAQSVSTPPDYPNTAPCGSSGTLYTNLRSTSVYLDLAVNLFLGYDDSCALTVSWTDSTGHAQTISLAPGGGFSKGVSTSLPAAGVISWAWGSGSSNQGFSFQLERVVSTKLW
jgi:hypothetical protein